MGVKTIICANCGKSHDIDSGEYNYQVRRGRENFFCSRTCSAQFNNKKNKKWFKRTQICKHCGKSFDTDSHYEVTFCSRECASAGSVTDFRRHQMSVGGKKGQLFHPGTPELTCQILKKREAWKYQDIKSWLDKQSINHEFEYLVDKYIFDLALFDYKTFIEFDSDYHLSDEQKAIDESKAQTARNIGWDVIHVATDCSVVLPASSVIDIIENLKHR